MSFDGTGEPELGTGIRTNGLNWTLGAVTDLQDERIARNASQRGIGADVSAATGL
jgi:hypothetical protein